MRKQCCLSPGGGFFEAPLSTHQEALVGLAHLLNKKARGKPHTDPIMTEHEAAVHIHESLARFLER